VRLKELVLVFVVLVPCFAWAADEPCDQKRAHVLDFWFGDWKVTDAKDGSFQGHDLVQSVLSGCAVIENWKGVNAGDEGKSLFVFDAAHGSWEQIWVTLDTSRPGGLKHKRLIEITPEGGTRFQGEITLPDGRIVLDRTTLSPMKNGRVHQVIENSKDGGDNWITGFDAYYSRY
jgi:hypothetical protein